MVAYHSILYGHCGQPWMHYCSSSLMLLQVMWLAVRGPVRGMRTSWGQGLYTTASPHSVRGYSRNNISPAHCSGSSSRVSTWETSDKASECGYIAYSNISVHIILLSSAFHSFAQCCNTKSLHNCSLPPFPKCCWLSPIYCISIK